MRGSTGAGAIRRRIIASTTGVDMSIRRPEVRSILSTKSANSPAPRFGVVSSL
jgi:hypothetical protein